MSPIPNKNTAEADKFDWCISPDYGIITICGGQFLWIDSNLQVCGDVILCSYTYKRIYDL